jgi:phospholipid transport system transporter-binding protein
MTVSGAVTLANAAQVLDEGRQHLAEGVHTVDLGEVTDMDSALLALVLAWLRDAKAAERDLALANVPEALQTLSRLYGVEALLPLASH